MQNRARVSLDFPFPEERVFRYQAMQDILHHLANNPFESFTQKELSTLTGADVSTVSRSVELLERLGVLDVTDEVPAMISIDQDHLNRPEPLFAIPQQQFREPVRGFLDELQTNITDSDEVSELVGVVLFGSVARGTADRRSDIDLLVILDGDATYARRIGTQSARSVEEGSFGGDRFEFEVLVETPESAASHGSELREIFDEGIVLEHSDSLDDVRQSIYADEEE